MRILIYSMSDDAKKLREELREAGNTVYLRDSDAYSAAPGEFEVADEVYTDAPNIKADYEARKIKVHGFKAKPAPKKRAAAKKKKG